METELYQMVMDTGLSELAGLQLKLLTFRDSLLRLQL